MCNCKCCPCCLRKYAPMRFNDFYEDAAIYLRKIIGRGRDARAEFEWKYCAGSHNARETFTLNLSELQERIAHCRKHRLDDTEEYWALKALKAEIYHSTCNQCGGEKSDSLEATFIRVVGHGRHAVAEMKYKYCREGYHHVNKTMTLRLSTLKGRLDAFERNGWDKTEELKAIAALEEVRNSCDCRCHRRYLCIENYKSICKGLYPHLLINGKRYSVGDVLKSEGSRRNGDRSYGKKGLVIEAITSKHIIYSREHDNYGKSIKSFDNFKEYDFRIVESSHCGCCCNDACSTITPEADVPYVNSCKLQPGDFIIGSKHRNGDGSYNSEVKKVLEVYSEGVVINFSGGGSNVVICNHTLEKYGFIKAHPKLAELWK